MLGHSKKREAIRECKRLWKAIEKSGLGKEDFLKSKEGKVWRDKQYINDCPLCDLTCFKCCDCLLIKQYDENCYDLGFGDINKPSQGWLNTIKGLKE